MYPRYRNRGNGDWLIYALVSAFCWVGVRALFHAMGWY